MLTLLDILHGFPGRGGKTAMVFRTGVRRFVYSYEQLYDYALKMNGWLAARGVREGDTVLLWGPNGPWWVAAFWGCIARGAVVVPVDFMSGRERAGTIAGLTDVRLAIQSRYKAERLADRPEALLEDLEYLLADVEPLPASAIASTGKTAQIIYTSGTTGNPKGVVLTHGNLIANLKQVNEHIPVVGPEYNFLSLLPLSHMFEQMGGFLTPMYRGAAVIYLQTLKPSAILEALHEEDVYAVIAVPRLLQLLRGSIERELAGKHLSGLFAGMLAAAERLPVACRKFLFYPVRRKFGVHFALFVSGGAALAPDDFRFWNAMGFTVVEGYGLTECSPVLAANTFERQVAGSVGKALPGVELRVDDGGISARGDNVFQGYYNNEQATGEAFTADGWFRTGDLGELNEEGDLYIKGRSKELIVTGAGVNVYPDEIEDILNRTPGVRDACVVGIDRGHGEEVHAVLILDAGAGKPDKIVEQANKGLDELHRITGWSIWPEAEFPKTTTLKIQKFKVKERLLAGEAVPSGVSADPFVNIIARVTGTGVADIHDDAVLATDLGLTSIGRLELVNYLEQEFRLDLDESAIDQKTTVTDLRKMVAARERMTVRSRLRFWTNRPAFRGIRKICDFLVHRPLFRHFATLDVDGLERLDGLSSPVMFIANHISYFDYPAIMFSLPSRWRYNTSTAAWEEFFSPEGRPVAMKVWKRFTYEYGTMVLNLFLLPQTRGFRKSLRFMGRLVDHGINVLLFPEGRRSQDGRLLQFQAGLGLMISELRIPVVPVHISGMEKVFPRGTAWPKRGKVSVRFGEPLHFTTQSPDEIVEKARNAVEVLKTNASPR
jgi:long-chain acyl-CoA synthetase